MKKFGFIDLISHIYFCKFATRRKKPKKQHKYNKQTSNVIKVCLHPMSNIVPKIFISTHLSPITKGGARCVNKCVWPIKVFCMLWRSIALKQMAICFILFIQLNWDLRKIFVFRCSFYIICRFLFFNPAPGAWLATNNPHFHAWTVVFGKHFWTRMYIWGLQLIWFITGGNI